MLQNLYAIRDRLAESIVGPVNVMVHDAQAVRMFRDVMSAGNNMISSHPQDHDLLRIGILDMTTGDITPENVVVITGASLAASLANTNPEGQPT